MQLRSGRVFVFFMWISRGKISKKHVAIGWVRRRAACGTAVWFSPLPHTPLGKLPRSQAWICATQATFFPITHAFGETLWSPDDALPSADAPLPCTEVIRAHGGSFGMALLVLHIGTATLVVSLATGEEFDGTVVYT